MSDIIKTLKSELNKIQIPWMTLFFVMFIFFMLMVYFTNKIIEDKEWYEDYALDSYAELYDYKLQVAQDLENGRICYVGLVTKPCFIAIKEEGVSEWSVKLILILKEPL